MFSHIMNCILNILHLDPLKYFFFFCGSRTVSTTKNWLLSFSWSNYSLVFLIVRHHLKDINSINQRLCCGDDTLVSDRHVRPHPTSIESEEGGSVSNLLFAWNSRFWSTENFGHLPAWGAPRAACNSQLPLHWALNWQPYRGLHGTLSSIVGLLMSPFLYLSTSCLATK